MQELRIQAENSAALCLADESRRPDFTGIPRSPFLGWRSQASQSTQTPERQREMIPETAPTQGWRSQAAPSTQTPESQSETFPATAPTQRIPGHLSYLTSSMRLRAAADGHAPEHERSNFPAVSALRVPSSHPPTLERISYPALGPTPKFPGHLSTIDNKSFKHDRESPISPTSSRSPLLPQRCLPLHPASPPLYSQQPPDHKGASDIEIKSNADKKEEIISIIQAIASRPLPNARLHVVADMILQSQTPSEIEGIISALDQNFPLVSVMGRLRSIVDFQRYLICIMPLSFFNGFDICSAKKTSTPHVNCADHDQSRSVREQEDRRSFSDASHYEAKRSAVHSLSIVDAQNYADSSYSARQDIRYGGVPLPKNCSSLRPK